MIITTRELVDRAAAAADMHDSFVTPQQWMYWATQENLALSLFLARSGWVQNVLTSTITVTGSESGAFPLTVSPLAIVAVHEVSTNGVRLLTLDNAIDFLHQLPGTPLASGHPTKYRVLWDQANDRLTLNFYPSPSAGMSFLVSYIPEPSKLTLDASPATGYANSIKIPMGWEERIVLGLARRALAKEESDTTDIIRQIRECDATVEEAVYERVLSEVPTIRNVDNVRRGWTSDMTFPSPLQWWWG